MRPRHVKRLYPAVPAECVLCDTRVKRVRRQFILTRDQAELAVRHEQMQETAHVADTAIAPRRLDVPRRINFKAHTAAVAATLVSRHFPFFLQTARWLLAGIAYSRTRTSPLSPPRSSSDSNSRMPMSGCRARKPSSNAALLAVLKLPF